MRPFKFRADAALIIRRKQEDEAQRTLNTAHAAERLALEREDAARAALARADEAVRTGFQAVTAAGELIWQGNWMTGLQRDLDRARQTLAERRSDRQRAAENAQHARMQVLVLERLKERQWRAWQLEARRAEQKALDELAGLRFAARQRATEER
jgi:flagellar protein FliJ